jgi:protease-4
MMDRKSLIFLFAMMAILFNGCAVTIPLLPKTEPLQERVIDGEGDRKILIVDVSGVITDEKKRSIGFREEPSPVDSFKESLKKASSDRKIAALIVRINSPGGTITASDIIHHEILEYKKKTGVRVVACMMDVAASGGYYVATAADEIVAHPTSITGSIGVIAVKFNVQALFGKIGVDTETVKSGDKKDMLSPFRPATPEEIKIVQTIIDQMNGRFIDVIVEGRKHLPRDAVVKLADGRIYTAQQALDLKLIDRMGYLDTAIDGVKKSLTLDKASVIMYYRPGTYKGTIYSEAGGNTTIVNLLPQDLESLMPQGIRFMYLWAP